MGLIDGLDIRIYAKKIFNFAQMNELRLGLESKINVSEYNNPSLSFVEMAEVRKNYKKTLNRTNL